MYMYLYGYVIAKCEFTLRKSSAANPRAGGAGARARRGRAKATAGAPAPEGVLPHRRDSGGGGTCTDLGLSSGVPVPRVPLHSLPTAPRVLEPSRRVRVPGDSAS